MEVGDQAVDRLEAVAGRDEDRRVALERLDRAVLAGRAFEQAQRGRADRDQPPARRARALSRSAVAASIRPHSACIRWSAVSSALTGRKVPGADMEGQRLARDPARVERVEQRGGEMQRRGRRGDRAFLPREHRLVIGAVGGVGRPLARRCRAAAASARRARAAARPARRRGSASRTRRRRLARPPRPGHPAPKSITSPSRSRLALRTKARQLARPLALVQRRADRCLAAPAFELGRDDLGVVEHQHVAGLQQLRQVEHGAVGDLAARRPAAAAPLSRGRAGRSAIRSGGRSKSKRSTRISEAPRRSRLPASLERRRSSHGRSWSARPAARRRRSRRPRPCPQITRPNTVYLPSSATFGREHDEELAVGAVRLVGARHRRRCRACAAGG